MLLTGNPQKVVTYTRGLDLSGSLEEAGGIGGLLARTEEDPVTLTSSTVCYHADGNGNVTRMIDEDEAVVAKYLYDPYGNVIGLSGTLAEHNFYRFSSKEYHPQSGLVYYLYRYYEPNLQRWPNRDPLGEEGWINLYAFIRNTPTSGIDAWGLDDADREFEERVKNGSPSPKPKGFKATTCFGPMTQEDADAWTRYFSKNEDIRDSCIAAGAGFACLATGVPPLPSIGIGFGVDYLMSGYGGPIFHAGDMLCFEGQATFNGCYDSGVVVDDAQMTIYPSGFIGPLPVSDFQLIY